MSGILTKIMGAALLANNPMATPTTTPLPTEISAQSPTCILAATSLAQPIYAREKTMINQQPIHDLSMPIRTGMLRFPGDPDVSLQSSQTAFGPGISITMSTLQMGLHLGTHIDAPAHFISGGLRIDQFPTETFIGPARILDLSLCAEAINASDLDRFKIMPGERIFLKTTNSRLLRSHQYVESHVFLKPETAHYLASRQISLLGFDYYNIDSSSAQKLDAHFILAQAGIPVIVAADMSSVSEGLYQMSAVPLLLVGAEASPVRVVIWKKE